MNKNLSFYISGGILLFAMVCMALAIASSKAKRAAEAEAYELREQVARMKPYVPDMDADRMPLPEATAIDTDDVDELKAMVAKKDAEVQQLLIQLAASQSNTNRPTRQRESFEDRISRMKEEDPEGYAEMVKQRGEHQQQMRYALAERTATFMDLDTSSMTEEELANHQQLVDKMARVWELTAQMQDPEAAPDREVMREMFTEMHDVRPMLDMERDVMFKQLGTDLGYESDDAEAFAAHINDILEATDIRMPSGRGGGGRGGGGGGGQGGGGGR